MNDDNLLRTTMGLLQTSEAENSRLRKQVKDLLTQLSDSSIVKMAEELSDANCKIKEMQQHKIEMDRERTTLLVVANDFSSLKQENAILQAQNREKDNRIELQNKIIQTLQCDKDSLEKGLAQITLSKQEVEDLKDLLVKQRFTSSSEKSRKLGKKQLDSDAKEKMDYDGSQKNYQSSEDDQDAPTTSSEFSETETKPIPKKRTDYSKNKTFIEKTIYHPCDWSNIPADARQIGETDTFEKITLFPAILQRDIYEFARLVTPQEEFLNTSIPFTPVLEKCGADASLLSFMLVNKYLYHLPIERQVDMFKEYGGEFSKSTLTDWFHKAIKKLRKIEAVLIEHIQKGEYFFIDETTHRVRVLDEQTGKQVYRRKYLWGVKCAAQKLAYYIYKAGSRARSVIVNFLNPIKNLLFTADGYIAYKYFDSNVQENQIRGGCMAHCRRKFVESSDSDPHAQEFINKIGELYGIEQECKAKLLDDESRRKVRQEKSIPILTNIYQRLKIIIDDKSTYYSAAFLKAVNYMKNDWNALIQFVSHGVMEIDNNQAELMMKPVKIGAKNWLFCGSHDAAEDTAFMYSLIESCKLNDIRPREYIEDLLRRITDDQTDYTALLPCNWVK